MSAPLDPQQVWLGPFPSWSEAVHQSRNSKLAWAQETWITRQASFLFAPNVNINLPPPRLTNLPLVAGLLGVSSIVDYGGGSGWAFEGLKAFCPQLDLQSYFVLELPEVVNAFNLRPIEDNRLFYTSFDQAGSLPAVDLMYANAALHYAESEQAFLETASNLGPVRHLLLDGFLAHPDFEFFFVQYLDGHGIPVRIPRLDASLAALHANGYRVTFCTPMLGPVGGVYRYDLPLEHFGFPYTLTGRYCITAVKG